MRLLSSFIFFVAAVWVSAATAQLPCGEPLAFVGEIPVEYPLHDADDGAEPWTLNGRGSVMVHRRGYVTLGRRLDFDPATHPEALADLDDDTRIIAPFWLPAASPKRA